MKFITKAPHYLSRDRYVAADVEIGDDTAFPLDEDFVPSSHMEGLDAEGRRAIDKLNERKQGGPDAGFAPSTKKSRELEKLRKENEELRESLAQVPKSGMEPFYPEASVGPTPFPQNIGMNPDGTRIVNDQEEEERRKPRDAAGNVIEDPAKPVANPPSAKFDKNSPAFADPPKSKDEGKTDEEGFKPNRDLEPKDTVPEDQSYTDPILGGPKKKK